MAGLPEVARLHEEYASRGLVVIGVHDASGNPEGIEQVLREKGIEYPVMRDTEARETFSAYRIMGIPHLILVGKDGTIVADGKPLREIETLIRRQLGVP
jgi:hypothetical protein